jgi:hypothetical protein
MATLRLNLMVHYTYSDIGLDIDLVTETVPRSAGSTIE